MIRNLFWFGLGAGSAVYALTKGKTYVQNTPKRVGRNVGRQAADAKASVLDRVASFGQGVKEGAAEREAELRDEVGHPRSTPNRRLRATR